MQNPAIQAAIAKGTTRVRTKFRVDAEKVLRQLITALSLNPLVFFDVDEKGRLKQRNPANVPAQYWKCVNKLTVTKRTFKGVTEETLKIELMNKDNMMALAMRHLGIHEPPKDPDDPTADKKPDIGIMINLLQQVAGPNANVIDASVMQAMQQKLLTESKKPTEERSDGSREAER